MKPKKFVLDEDEHPSTMDSLKWAENQLGTKMVIPHIDPPPMSLDSPAYDKVFDYNDDEDVSTTLKSAHQAEMIYGLHTQRYNYGGYGGNYSNSTNGNYTYGYRSPQGLNGEAEQPQY